MSNEKKGLFPKAKTEIVETVKEALFPETETPETLTEPETEMSAHDEFMQGVEEPVKITDDYFNAMAEAAAKAIEENKLNEITGEYLKLSDFKKDEKRVFIFTGMSTFIEQKTGATIPAAQLVGAQNKINYICASSVVVSACAKIDNFPCAVIIQSKGKAKSAKGEYYDASVFTV